MYPTRAKSEVRRGQRVRPLLLGAVCMALLVPGCARNPVTGRPQVVLISTEKEKQLGREEAVKVERTMGLVKDAKLVAWVTEIGNRLARYSPRQDVEYTFHVVDMPEPNAFALPGGFVYVSRGLLTLINQEDELAGVIGHEIGHVAARHSVSRMSVQTPFAIAFGVPSMVVGTFSKTLGGVIGGFGAAVSQGFVIAPYSRGQERHADEIGIELAAKAGWDPAALSRFLNTLERDVSLTTGASRRPGFFDSHPSTPSRVADTARLAAGLERAPGEPIAGTRSALFARLDGLLVGPNPAQGAFLDELFVQPELGFALRFPKGWQTDNTPTFVAGAPKDARDTYVVLQLAGEGDDPVEAARKDGVGEALLAKLDRTEISGQPAARLVTSSRGHGIDLSWIAHRGRIYRIAGVAPENGFESQAIRFASVATSFRNVSQADLDRLREGRLRIHPVRAGEGLAGLIARTGSSWKPAKVAVANGLPDTASIEAGRPLKLAIPETYRAPAR